MIFMNWEMREFDKMSREELEFAKLSLSRQLAYKNEIAEDTTDDDKHMKLKVEINDLEVQYETVCQYLGLL